MYVQKARALRIGLQGEGGHVSHSSQNPILALPLIIRKVPGLDPESGIGPGLDLSAFSAAGLDWARFQGAELGGVPVFSYCPTLPLH